MTRTGQRARRARSRTAAEVPQFVKDTVDARDGTKDRMTGHFLGGARNLHHRQLRSQGGQHYVVNLVTLSGSGTTGSHGWVHAHPAAARRLGFIVPSFISDPGDVPLLVAIGERGRRWVLFRENGHVASISDEDVIARMHGLGVWMPGETWIRGEEVPDGLAQGG